MKQNVLHEFKGNTVRLYKVPRLKLNGVVVVDKMAAKDQSLIERCNQVGKELLTKTTLLYNDTKLFIFITGGKAGNIAEELYPLLASLPKEYQAKGHFPNVPISSETLYLEYVGRHYDKYLSFAKRKQLISNITIN